MEVARLSDVGRVRPHNEDRLLADPALIAVADGMGGAQAGEVAAAMAVEAISELPPPLGAERVRDAVEEANRAIRSLAGTDPDKAGMGTTVTAAMLDGGLLAVVHVGDSRAYLWRDGELRQLTDDHSVVGELVRRGSLSPEEAETHPHRNVITRALGAEPEVQVDVVQEEPRAGDVVLLCSDGLSSYVSHEAIAGDLAHAESLEDAARRMVDRANAAGGADNVTVVLARIDEVEGAAVEADEDGEGGATRQVPRADAGARGDTAEIPVLGGLHGRAARDGEGSGGVATARGRPPRLLEPVGRRRSRLGPVLAGLAVLAVAGAATLAWVGSRNYPLGEGEQGTVVVRQGLPLLGLAASWQDTGVPADAVRAADAGALDVGWSGEGEAVLAAVALTLRHGLPEPPAIVPAPESAPVPAPAATEDPSTALPGTDTAAPGTATTPALPLP